MKIETGTDELLCDLSDRVALITLNKPHKRNALGDILTPALRALIPTLEERADVGCIMITGAGESFCSGGDVSEMGSGSATAPRSEEERVLDLTRRQETLTGRLYHCRKPTVAALPGPAAGAGLSIALACDLRVASDRAFITTAFRNIGLSGDYGVSWFLPRLVGLARAKSLMFRAGRIPAAECLAMGLVDEVYDHEHFSDRALAYASTIANGPTGTLGRMKFNLQEGLGLTLAESLQLEARHMVASASDPEAGEAIRAFNEKRAPRFHPPDSES